MFLEDLPPPAMAQDAAVPAPDGSVLCDTDEDCDDGVECTVDQCLDPGGYCLNQTDRGLCSDGVFCNGEELCDPVDGCLPGPPETCDDGDVCTIDVCDEEAKRCLREERDFDRDGEIDWHCQGTDCDDFDADRGASLPEVCGDLIDNDCDDLTDETMCGQLDHDTCEDAFEVPGPGTYSLGITGAARDYTLLCEPDSTRDVVFTFELEQTRAVDLVVRGVNRNGNEEAVAVALRDDCVEVDRDVECQVGFPAGFIRRRALPAGRYFAIVDSPRAAEVVLTLELSEPFEEPANAACDGAVDVSAGGRFQGSFVDVPDTTVTPCGPSGQMPTPGFPELPRADLYYRFTTTEVQDVLLSAVSLTDEPLGLTAREGCATEVIFRACRFAGPAFTRLHELPPGTYFVAVESPSFREVDFELDVRFLDPTSAPVGDECGDPVPIELDTPASDSLRTRQDRIASSCELFGADIVYQFDVESPTDLNIQADASTDRVAFAVQSVCGDPATELACLAGRRVQGRLRNVQPGSYSLLVESPGAGDVDVVVEALDVTVPMPVADNGLCVQAVDIPLEGALFEGSTSGFQNDYTACGNSESADVAFRLELDAPRLVTARVEASFDSVLYRYADGGMGPSVCMDSLNFASCNDDQDGSNAGLISEALEPGVYYYVLDGFGTASSGPYVIEFLLQ